MIGPAGTFAAPKEAPVSEYDFRTCPRCNGYGILDSARNCANCGGKGTHGLRSKDGVIGSGEIIVERATGRQISHAEFAKRIKERRPSTPPETK